MMDLTQLTGSSGAASMLGGVLLVIGIALHPLR
jgi:hypothetical protein